MRIPFADVAHLSRRAEPYTVHELVNSADAAHETCRALLAVGWRGRRVDEVDAFCGDINKAEQDSPGFRRNLGIAHRADAAHEALIKRDLPGSGPETRDGLGSRRIDAYASVGRKTPYGDSTRICVYCPAKARRPRVRSGWRRGTAESYS